MLHSVTLLCEFWSSDSRAYHKLIALQFNITIFIFLFDLVWSWTMEGTAVAPSEAVSFIS